MAYFIFATQKAEYIFEGTNHLVARRKEGLFDGIDAVITETSMSDEVTSFEEGSALERSLFASRRGNAHLLNQIKHKGIPIFCVDVDTADSSRNVYADTNPFTLSYWWNDLRYSFSTQKVPDDVQQFMSAMNQKCKQPIIAGRSVVAAEKIEGALAYQIQQRTKKRMPCIALLYGMQHVDMIDYLRDRALRRRMLHHFEQQHYHGLKREKLNKVRQYVYVPNERHFYPGMWHVERTMLGMLDCGRVVHHH